MKRRTILASTLLVLASMALSAQDFSIASPDGNLVMTVHNGDKLTYDLSMGGKTLIAESPMGFCFKGEGSMDGNFAVCGEPAVSSGVEQWIPVVKNRHAKANVPYNTIKLKLREKSGDFRNMGLEIRVMDGAAAFRYTLYGNMNVGMRYITKELTGFSLPADAALYKSNFAYGTEGHPYKTSQEGEFIRTAVKDIEAGVPIGLPGLIQLDGDTWMAITEANIDNFPAFHLDAGEPAGGRQMLHPGLTPLFTEPETELCARFDEEITSSWRVIMAADTPGRFIENDIIQSLNPPCAIKDPSWIKAGMSAWDNWWSADVKMEMPVIKRYIDLAAAENWPYMLVDWTWYGPHTRPDAIITKPAEQIDMPEIIRYAESKGVKIWLWLRSEDTNNNDAWREAFPIFHEWGVVGVKIDFMDREDQDMVNWYRRIIKACADNELMLDFHGAYKPDGIERTYPNMMTREGVMGNEYNKWSARVTPEHNINLAFTRMIAGPMDYTPGGFINESLAAHGHDAPAGVINTRAAELSKFVIYESPFMVFCDHPDYVLGQPGADFLNGMPTEWDDTRFLGGLPGEYVAIARRNGTKWYIGVMGNSDARELSLDLSFISAGPMQVEYWQDGKKAAKDFKDLAHGTLNLKAGAPLKIKLAPSGGFVATVETAQPVAAAARTGRWSAEKAWAWAKANPWFCGFNYVPTYAVNDVEIWAQDTFNADVIREELALAKPLGMNCVRIFLQYKVYEDNRQWFLNAFEQFVQIAAESGLKVMPVLFDDCCFGTEVDPHMGVQKTPLPGWGMGSWVASPGLTMVATPSTWGLLEGYLKDLITRYKDDDRIFLWDLYNEPTIGCRYPQFSLDLSRKCFEWAREVNPSQPISICSWNYDEKVNELVCAESDVITYHAYFNPEGTQKKIDEMLALGRPVICTEWLLRTGGCTVDPILGMLKDNGVGSMLWGLKCGRVQDELPGNSYNPDWVDYKGVWKHDLFRNDGTPYSVEDLELIKKATGVK